MPFSFSLIAADVLSRAQLSHQRLGRLQPLPGARVPGAGPGGDPAHRPHAGGGQPRRPGPCRRCRCRPEAHEDRQAGGRSRQARFTLTSYLLYCVSWTDDVLLVKENSASFPGAGNALSWQWRGRATTAHACSSAPGPASQKEAGALRDGRGSCRGAPRLHLCVQQLLTSGPGNERRELVRGPCCSRPGGSSLAASGMFVLWPHAAGTPPAASRALFIILRYSPDKC